MQRYMGGLLMVALCGYLWKLYWTGTILVYINPRFVPFTLAAIALMALLGGFSLWSGACRGRQSMVGRWTYAAFAMVIAIAWLAPPKALDPAMALQKNAPFAAALNGSGSDGGTAGAPATGPKTIVDLARDPEITQEQLDRLTGTDIDEEAALAQPAVGAKKQVSAIPPAGEITITAENYVEGLEELFAKPDAYAGRPIRVEGFAYRDKDFRPDQFVAARYQIVCCAADATVIGLLAEGMAAPTDAAWVEVRGKLRKGEYQGKPMPVIAVTSLRAMPEPPNPYVYRN
ncbi:TIGR03943 family putative permease subunit [Heliomicrobium gestii]|nr:TIGR03943 family protein [Heliomicrobium gestii]